MELSPVADARQLVSKRDEARRLLIDSPASLRPVRECSTTVKSSSDRRGILSRMAAVDLDDSESQTSSSCPTSSSSTSTTPSGGLSMSPTVQHDVTRVKSTRISPLAIASVSGTPSRKYFPLTAACLHTLLPPERNNEIFSKLRTGNPLKYPIPYSS